MIIKKKLKINIKRKLPINNKKKPITNKKFKNNWEYKKWKLFKLPMTFKKRKQLKRLFFFWKLKWMTSYIKYNTPRYLFYIKKPKKILLKKKLYIKKMLSYYYSISNLKEIKKLIKYSKKINNSTTTVSTLKNFTNVLESRLCIFITRIGWASNPFLSKSIITQGNVIINGKIIYKPNYNLKKGDVIQFTNLFIKKLQFNKFFKKNNKNNWKRWKRKKLWFKLKRRVLKSNVLILKNKYIKKYISFSYFFLKTLNFRRYLSNLSKLKNKNKNKKRFNIEKHWINSSKKPPTSPFWLRKKKKKKLFNINKKLKYIINKSFFKSIQTSVEPIPMPVIIKNEQKYKNKKNWNSNKKKKKIY